MRRLISVLVLFPAMTLHAADLPNIDIQNEKASSQECVAQKTNDCINTVCLNSPALDCNEQCQKSAEDECTALQDE